VVSKLNLTELFKEIYRIKLNQGEVEVSEREWVQVDEVSGGIQAEILRGLLESQGIAVWLNQEGAGKAYGISLSSLGSVQILVPSDVEERALELINAYYANELSGEDLDVIGGEQDEDIDID
jgi:hypothetical protein